MRELELRLALVFYGGASLAVYMNGVSNEILKLVRASHDFHSIDTETTPSPARERPDTEQLYLELLRALAPKVRLRVVVDVISGASAGGINGVFLARALAHDLSLDPLREMWLNLADVEELMEEETISDKRSKFYLYPLLWLFRRRALAELGGDIEARRKIYRFVRSRWFEPPFSGRRMLDWMLDATARQGKSKTTGNSLLPIGQRLDLFLSLTNFFGQRRRIVLHDPPEIGEKRHGISLNFTYRKFRNKIVESDFDDDNIPGLGFGARATSSFPGAFPAISLADLYKRLAERGQTWPMEERFLRHNFADQLDDPDELQKISFMDGGIINNKPFGAARDAIHNRPAHREVDRRLVYVDPAPQDDSNFDSAASGKHPGFFRMILSAIAEIPRNEPIYDDLQEIALHNAEVGRFDAILDTAAGTVEAIVDAMVGPPESQGIDAAFLSSWIEQSHIKVREQAGFGYASYLRSKTLRNIDRLATLLVQLRRPANGDEKIVRDELDDWVRASRLLSASAGDTEASKLEVPQLINFLRRFDVGFRVRRLRYVLRTLNAGLSKLDGDETASSLRAMKKQTYHLLEMYEARWDPEFYGDVPDDVLVDLGGLIDWIGERMDLEALDLIQHDDMADCFAQLNGPETRNGLLRAYLGYSFFDVLTLPIIAHGDPLDLDEIRVDRISPTDSGHVFKGDLAQPLRGRALGNFAAFFSRGARENDYLWGRLHAATRLVDFLLDAVGPEALPDGFDLLDFRIRLYRSILATEEKFMTVETQLPDRIRAGLAAMPGENNFAEEELRG